MKYSINGTGNIVAERDIYSLGGFIPKGSVGGKIASKAQLSQDGECWVAGGDISGRPDVRVKDNAYIGDFVGATGMHTDGVTEFSGDTLIPGKIIVRNPIADPVNNFFAKDSFIGVSMDALCGPASTATAFPFEQGGFNKDVPAGTLFTSASMHTSDANVCRTTANLCLGKDTYIYTPAGYGCRILWGYWNTAGQLAYSGESFAVSQALAKLEHPTYRLAMVHITKTNGTAMTPADLLATGAKILGHINSSPLIDIRPESASGQYVMVNSSFLTNTDNFGLATTQRWYLAGGLYNTSVYTLDNRAENKLYGTFHSVQRLEYDRYLSDTYRTNVNRDRFISAYDCPLLRVDNSTYDAFAAKGDLVLRRCIVPKAEFKNDVINGNTYEDIDFSYANEDLGYTMAGYTRFISSHKQGIYRLSSGPSLTGFASHKGNLDATARLYQGEVYIPLDGSIMEQGFYGGGNAPYESVKSNSTVRVRTGKPLPTFGLVFPSLPAGYSVKAFTYLGEDFITRSLVTDPTGLDTTYPYVVMVFRKDDDSAINVNEFIALNRTLRIIDHTKAPEITGSAYVGAGCTVRGDVKLIGDPYINQIFDVNMWERGGVAYSAGKQWLEMKDGSNPHMRMSTKDMYPVKPGDTITLTGPYRLGIVYFDSEKKSIRDTGWITGTVTVPTGASYAGFGLSSNPDGKLLEYSDIPLANVKYVRAFKKRRYITNELDRTSPEDIMLGPDMWEQGSMSSGEANAGKTYDELKAPYTSAIRLKKPINVYIPGQTTGLGAGFASARQYLDAGTKLYSPAGADVYAKTALITTTIVKSPAAAILPSEAPDARFIIEFIPSPRIIVPYGSSTLFISGPKIRMYDNAVLSRNLNQEGEIVLRGDAVMGYDFNSGDCMCSNGHSDAIIKLP